MMTDYDPASAARPEPDALLQHIAGYTLAVDCIASEEAFETARLCLMDSLGCGLFALNYPACVKLLGPVVPGATMPGRGARVPGTLHELDPVQAATQIAVAEGTQSATLDVRLRGNGDGDAAFRQ